MCPNTGVLETVNALWIIHDKFNLSWDYLCITHQNKIKFNSILQCKSDTNVKIGHIQNKVSCPHPYVA